MTKRGLRKLAVASSFVVKAFCLLAASVTVLFAETNTTVSASMPEGKLAAKPLFRDSVYDGAADPVVIWNRDGANPRTALERGRSLARSARPHRKAPLNSTALATITRCDRGPVALRRAAIRGCAHRDEPTHINLVPLTN